MMICLSTNIGFAATSGNQNMRTVVTQESSGEISNNLLYISEYDHAYAFALEHGITTKQTIEEADMSGILTRSQMAKMIANYAINVLGQMPNTSIVCPFADLSGQSAEMQSYIIQACQLWLMGKNIQNFYPAGNVTRAELWTVLSRMLYKTPESTNGDPYYLIHLNILKANGVITNTNPNLFELRAYLMLMLMRAAK